MSKKLNNIKIHIDDNLDEVVERHVPNYSSYRILRKSIDARKRHELREVYSLEVFEKGEAPAEEDFSLEKIKKFDGKKPVIVGSGPAGLFAALRLVEHGIPCVLLERGKECSQRMLKINRYWRYGELDEDNNVCFGEGGAGLYSDGKLITRIKSPYISYVMDRLVKFGAPEEIKYLSNPHVGSDKIRRVIPLLRDYLLKNQCEIHFEAKVDELLTRDSNKIIGVKCSNGQTFETDDLILATGHSANDMFYHLEDIGVFMEAKPFAVGLRIEHPQKKINQIQYRDFADHPKLGSANYKLTWNNDDKSMGVYSFCMCPGGYILSSGTDNNAIVSNGMSNYRRNSPFANAAIVVTFDPEKHLEKNEKFSGLTWRKQMEEKAFQKVQSLGGKHQLPAQKVTDFLRNKSGELDKSSCPSGGVGVNFSEIYPEFVVENLKEALHSFDKKMKGFVDKDVQLFGVETRTSCPLRITRDKETLESVSHKGLYPTGEGAGYAGGITSAAVDGIRVAEKIFEQYK